MTLNPKILTLLTLVNTAMLFLLAFFVFSNRSSEEGGVEKISSPQKEISIKTQSVDRMDGNNPSGGTSDFASLLEQTIQPLKQASSDHNENIDLPTEKEITAALDSNTLDSPETLVVIEKLRKGYGYYNMPFPTLRIPKPQKNLQERPSSMRDSSAGPEIASWMKPTIERLEGELRDRGESGEGIIPSIKEQKAAIDSNAWDSQETDLVLDLLRKGFARYSIDFPEPKNLKEFNQRKPTPSTGGSSSEQLSSKQRIIQAYFKGQIQRLRLEANAKSFDIIPFLPTDEEVFQAVKTVKLDSDESKIVLDRERAAKSLRLFFMIQRSQDRY